MNEKKNPTEPDSASTDGNRPSRRRRILALVGGVIVALLAPILLLGLVPASLDGLTSAPDPAVDYEESVARFEQLQTLEAPHVTDLTRSTLLTDGEPTERAYVLIHGLTNSPHQFAELGELLHERGHNVLILRMPYHGLRSHTVSELSHLTAVDLRAYADEAIDIAAGLGNEVGVVGLSGGGAVTVWIAQNRSGVADVVAISPFLGIAHTPAFLDWFLANLFTRIPNLDFVSADEEEHAWGYRGESSRGVAAFMLLGRAAMAEARENRPPVDEITALTTAVEDNVDNRTTTRLVDLWRDSGVDVSTHEFEAALDIPHDSVDSSTAPNKRRIVYAEILAALGEAPLE